MAESLAPQETSGTPSSGKRVNFQIPHSLYIHSLDLWSREDLSRGSNHTTAQRSLPSCLWPFELAGYTSIVSNLAREGRGQDWMRYDQLFRQAAATNPELPWHKFEPDIWQMAVMIAVRSLSTCLVAQQGQPPADQDKICCCRNRGSCTLPYCRFRRVLVCCEVGNITKDCPTLVSQSANRPATK